MSNKLFVKILVPIIILMLGLGTLLYFVALRTVNEFAQQNIAGDLDDLSHDLFNIVDNGYLDAIKTGKINDKITLRISQVDCLDMLERKTFSHQFKLIVFEDPDHAIRMASPLPGQVTAKEIIRLFHVKKNHGPFRIADENFYVRQFYFSPWHWNFILLKNTKTYAQLSRKVQHVYLTSIIVLIVATIVFSSYLLHSIKRPISSIINSLAEGKSPHYRGTYEFEYLSNAIAEMRTSLKNEVRERKRAEKSAEMASKAKSEFLANMSHELRTPLNAILGFAQIMARNSENPANDSALRIIQRSGKHLLTLINQVLDLSKIEAGQLKIENTSFDLRAMLDELKSMLMLRATNKEISLDFQISRDVPRYVRADEVKLRQILINLLNNAITFTEEGYVALRVTSRQKKRVLSPGENDFQPISSSPTGVILTFTVEDSGPGIAGDEFANLFQAFKQTSSGKKTGEGTGLGLAISKKFIDLLGGEISLESDVGKGSCFVFSIPARTIEEPATERVRPTAKVIAQQQGEPERKILIVDDKRDNRELLVRMLAPLEFELRQAKNGQEALDLLEDWQPDLIFMDIRMPGMDGPETTMQIRNLPSLKKQPVIIAVTANIFYTKTESLVARGFNGILIKPFSENKLFILLSQHLNVQFAHEPQESQQEHAHTAGAKVPVLPVDLAGLPEKIITKLTKSIAALRMSESLEIIEEIRAENEQLAETLRQLVLEYRFDTLQQILEQKEQNTAQL